MPVAVANARLTVAAPVRKERRFGLFSVVDVVDGGDSHWLLGGITADGEECSRPEGTTILCGPTTPKTSRSWYSDIDADPWLAYMYETCKTVGRVNESAAKLRARFLASEQSAVETELQDNVLDNATSIGAFPSVIQAVGSLEAHAAAEYGGQIIIHLGFLAAEEAFSKGGVVRVGDHLETHAGSLVSVGNYHPDHAGGTAAAPVVYATGATVLYRSSLIETGPVFGRAGAQNEFSNDYYVLVERGYAALVDCYMARATGALCDCGDALGADPQSGETDKPNLDEGSQMTAATLGIVCGATNSEIATALNIRGVTPNPIEDWGVGNCASIDCGADVDREVRWNGHAWVGC